MADHPINHFSFNLCLDASGSMSSWREAVISLSQRAIRRLRNQTRISGKILHFSVSSFQNDHQNFKFQLVYPQDAASMVNEDYDPAGSTPLYDAVVHLPRIVLKETGSEAAEDWDYTCVVLTDGANNSSKSTCDEAMGVIDRYRRLGWKFMLLHPGHVNSRLPEAFDQNLVKGFNDVDSMLDALDHVSIKMTKYIASGGDVKQLTFNGGN